MANNKINAEVLTRWNNHPGKDWDGRPKKLKLHDSSVVLIALSWLLHGASVNKTSTVMQYADVGISWFIYQL